MKSRKAVVLALLLCAIAYYVYEPVPPGWKQPWKTRLCLASFRFTKDLANVATLFGYNGINASRALREIYFPLVTSNRQLLDQIHISEAEFDGVKVRLFDVKGRAKKNSPAVVYYHGGGWVYGTTTVYESVFLRLAHDLGIPVVAVEYRLAPEYTAPIPLEDCVKATKYLFLNAHKFGVDPNRIVLMGDSAGGHFTTTVSMKLKEEHFKFHPKLNVMFYPALQAVNLQSPSYQANQHGPYLTRLAMAVTYGLHAQGQLHYMDDIEYNQHVPHGVMQELSAKYMSIKDLPKDDTLEEYIPVESPESVAYWDDIKNIILDPYFSPLFAPDDLLQDLPKTYIAACQYDVLRDDAIWYKKRLEENDVQVDIDIWPCFHAWNLYSEVLEDSSIYMQKIVQFVQKHI